MKKGDQGISGQRPVRIESVDLNKYLFPSTLDDRRRWPPGSRQGRRGTVSSGAVEHVVRGRPGGETRWNEVGWLLQSITVFLAFQIALLVDNRSGAGPVMILPTAINGPTVTHPRCAGRAAGPMPLLVYCFHT